MADADGSVVLVPVGDGELDVAAGLMRRFFDAEGFTLDRGDVSTNLRGALGPGIGWAVMALRADAPAGIATVQLSRSVEFGIVAEIGDLWVEPDHRRAGVAMALVDACCAWAETQGSSAIQVTVTPDGERRHGLSSFYRRIGFAGTGRTIRSRRLS